MCECMFVWMYVCIRMYVCIFLYIYLLARSITLMISNTKCYLHLVFTIIVSSSLLVYFVFVLRFLPVNLLTVLLSVLF